MMPEELEELEKWPTEREAARELGVSTKTITRDAERGWIEMRKRPRPGKKPENVCNPRDIERLKPAAHVMPEDMPKAKEAPSAVALARAPFDPAPILTMIRAIATAIETERQGVQTPKLWLSLEEAAECSGLSKHYLRGSIVRPDHYVPGQNLIGIRGGPHGALRILRASLEAFVG